MHCTFDFGKLILIFMPDPIKLLHIVSVNWSHHQGPPEVWWALPGPFMEIEICSEASPVLFWLHVWGHYYTDRWTFTPFWVVLEEVFFPGCFCTRMHLLVPQLLLFSLSLPQRKASGILYGTSVYALSQCS